MRKIILISICCFVCWNSVSIAQDYESNLRALAQARSLKCSFPTGIGAHITENGFDTEKDGYSNDIHFDSINLKTGSARMIGNVGAVDVVAEITPTGLFLYESIMLGGTTMTTVYPIIDSQGRFMAVTTKHNMLPDQSGFAMHLYGTCIPW